MNLERRIASALSDDITAADLAALVDVTEQAISEAGAAVLTERERAMDPIAVPDANEARARIERAEFGRDRLRTALPPLRTKLAEVRHAEHAAKWEADYEGVKVERDEWAAEFAVAYPELVAELVNLFRNAEAVVWSLLPGVLLTASAATSPHSPVRWNCRHGTTVTRRLGRRPNHRWQRCTRCRWDRSMTHIIRPTGRARVRRTSPRVQRPKPNGLRRRKRAKRRANAVMTKACCRPIDPTPKIPVDHRSR
jgi:hypothetical protein